MGNRFRLAAAWWAPSLAVAVGLAFSAAVSGCNNEPKECTRGAEGEYLIQQMDPPVFGSVLSFTATVVSARSFASVPPSSEYKIQRHSDNQVITLLIQDLGHPLPVATGSAYDFQLEMIGGVPPTSAIKVSDSQGVRFLGVSDWKPNYSVFTGGYGDLAAGGSAGTLQVFFGSAGCSARVENTKCFNEIRNYRLEFLLGASTRAKLWQGDQGAIGGWTAHVYKAEIVQVTSDCVDQLQNQISFFVERDGL